ncbi:hypothetical protein GGR50DRAFT_698153 [Xylaria sp. CBS 124048]|nr:hypothetical protein GGR50DRAFT_698153 [Xylaria sp. CBS 124048]
MSKLPIVRVKLTQTLRPRVARNFATSRAQRAKNQIYDPVRRPDDLNTYQRLASSSRIPLLTLWTTSWCATCRVVSPLLRRLVAEEGVGEDEGGVAFCTVEYDAPDMMTSGSGAGGLGMTYAITTVPTLISFDAGGAPAVGSRVTDGRRLADRAFLEEWIREEARRGNGGGSGGGGSGGNSGIGGLIRGWR